MLVLRMPADVRAPVSLARLASSAVAFSEAIGGGYLDDGLAGTVDGRSYVVLLDEHRVPKALPPNQRAGGAGRPVRAVAPVRPPERGSGAMTGQRGLHLVAVFADVRGRTESGVYRLVEYLRAGGPSPSWYPSLGP